MISPLTFLRETKDELQQVVWPSKTEVIRLTTIVLAISLIVGMYVGGLDFLFTKLIEVLI